MRLDHVSRALVTLALDEDLGPGDVTSALVPADAVGEARILAKQDLVLAGLAAFDEVYRQLDDAVTVTWTTPEGTRVESGTVVGTLAGPSRSLLVGERPALNLLQRLTGVATMARQAADAVAGTSAKVVDTRKTTPGMRTLQKAAVRAGGAFNHRFGLFDGVLIKDNHIAAVGGVKAAIERAREAAHHLVKIEVEVKSLAQIDEALEARADVIMLDNMSLDEMRAAVAKIDGAALVEASGGVTLETLAEIAKTGVDFVSMGALTHSATAADISLDWIA